MRKCVSMVVGVLMVAGVSYGGTLTGVMKWAEKVGDEGPVLI